MFKWLRELREEIKSITADDNGIVAKSSEGGELPCDVDPIEELVRIVGSDDAPRCRNDAGAARTGARRIRPRRP